MFCAMSRKCVRFLARVVSLYVLPWGRVGGWGAEDRPKSAGIAFHKPGDVPLAQRNKCSCRWLHTVDKPLQIQWWRHMDPTSGGGHGIVFCFRFLVCFFFFLPIYCLCFLLFVLLCMRGGARFLIFFHLFCSGQSNSAGFLFFRELLLICNTYYCTCRTTVLSSCTVGRSGWFRK